MHADGAVSEGPEGSVSGEIHCGADNDKARIYCRRDDWSPAMNRYLRFGKLNQSALHINLRTDQVFCEFEHDYYSVRK